MKLTKNDLLVLCDTAVEAARAAGKFISEYDRSESLQVNIKENVESVGAQVVTEVDLLSQKIILSILHPTLEKYDLGMLAEESTDDKSRLQKDYFWCIDPLDGTLPFIQSIPGYSVLISLISKEGIPQIGVVFDPLKNDYYSAIIDQGASCNGKALKMKVCSSVPRAPFTLVCLNSLKKHPRFDEVIEKLNPQSIEYFLGGGAMNIILHIINSTSAAAWFMFPKPEEQIGGGGIWDYASIACILKEVGGFSAGLVDGKPLDLNRSDSPFMGHRGVLFTNCPELAHEIRQKLGFFLLEKL